MENSNSETKGRLVHGLASSQFTTHSATFHLFECMRSSTWQKIGKSCSLDSRVSIWGRVTCYDSSGTKALSHLPAAVSMSTYQLPFRESRRPNSSFSIALRSSSLSYSPTSTLSSFNYSTNRVCNNLVHRSNISHYSLTE